MSRKYVLATLAAALLSAGPLFAQESAREQDQEAGDGSSHDVVSGGCVRWCLFAPGRLLLRGAKGCTVRAAHASCRLFSLPGTGSGGVHVRAQE